MHRDTYIPHSDYITPYPEHTLKEVRDQARGEAQNPHAHTSSHATPNNYLSYILS